MSREIACELWGSDAVDLALADASPEVISADLVAEIRTNADPPGALRAWALAQPWPRFCAIVRVVSGALREEVEKHGED